MRVSLFLVVLGFLIFGCSTEAKKTAKIEIETFTPDAITYPEKEIRIPDSVQRVFIENFFIPWSMPAEELLANLDRFPGKELSYLQNYLEDDAWYGENKKPHVKSQRDAVVATIDKKNFPNFLQRGIVTAHTDLRRIPTKRPGFDTYSKAGEGYPFDYFQETNLWANTPLFLVHLSNDKQWCYVISPIYKGWVAMRDIAIADEDFILNWSTGNYCMPLSDELKLQNGISHYAVKAKMGMVLPYEKASDTDTILTYFANADENQNARILKAKVNKKAVAFDNYTFNQNHLKQLVSNLVGKPYGWGGYLENRDCSSMIRDLMGTYRIWLPRDSDDQINSGVKYDLPKNAEAKINFIKEKAVPFFTILRKKGHNMLYVGNSPKGEPLILHAIWGLKTAYDNEQLAAFSETYPIEGIHTDENGKAIGRYIIGEAVITSVNAGADVDYVIEPLIDEIYAMTTILDRKSIEK